MNPTVWYSLLNVKAQSFHENQDKRNEQRSKPSNNKQQKKFGNQADSFLKKTTNINEVRPSIPCSTLPA